MDSGVLQCSKCLIWKERNNFTRDKNRKSGHYPYCKDCKRPQALKWRIENREKIRTNSREWHQLHKEERNIAMREAAWQKRGLKLTFEEWIKFLADHGDQCEYPGCEETENLTPDHDHVDGTLRGILCGKHNRALGLFGDSIEGLQRAIDYLEMAKRRK